MIKKISLTRKENLSIVNRGFTNMPLSQDDIIKYKSLYLQTARNYLQNMQLNISFLLKKKQTKIAINQIHIDSHSLKSQSQIMGYDHIAKVAEIIEDLFKKEENVHMKRDVLIRIQSDLSRLHDSLTEIEKQGKETDLTEVINKLKSCVSY